MRPSIKLNFFHKDRQASITPEDDDEVLTKMMKRPISSLDLPDITKMGFLLEIDDALEAKQNNTDEKSTISFRGAESYDKAFVVSNSEEADAFFNLIGRLAISPDEMLSLVKRGFVIKVEGRTKDIVQFLKERAIPFSNKNNVITIE